MPFMNMFNSFNMFSPFNCFQPNYSFLPMFNFQNSIFFRPNTNFQPYYSFNYTNQPERLNLNSNEVSLVTNTQDNTSENLSFGVNYNKEKGNALAQAVVECLPVDRDPQNPLCARYVKNALAKTGLSPYINGNGEYCKYILRANENFKEVNVKGEDLANLPRGSIVVYDANDAIYGKDGHVLVALGDGRGCSDIIENTIPKSDNAYAFIPI